MSANTFLDDWLSHHAASKPEETAVVCRGRRVSYLQLERHVDACAAALAAAGLAPGDRVAVLACPGLEAWCSALAVMRLGAIWMGLNPRYRLAELQYLLDDSRPKLVLSISAFEGRDYLAELDQLRASSVRGYELLALEELVSPSTAERSAVGVVERDRYRAGRSPVAPAALVYTSGSSGRPKGALLSHHGLVSGAAMQVAQLDVSPQSMVVCFPINHVAYLADTCATTLLSGGKVVFQERFEAASLLRVTAEERCNMLGGVPTMLQLLLEDPAMTEVDLSALELIAWGGAAMPFEYLGRLQRLAPRLMTLYGLTETAANIAFGDSRDGLEALCESVGKPDPAVGCRVVDDQGRPCPPGAVGELQFRADFFFLGYWKREEATSNAWTADGWFRSGDIGTLDADGRIRLKGRLSEMFKSGGYNVYPRELEMALEEIPGVSAAAVVGVPDLLYQEVGCAWIVTEPGHQLSEAALRNACRQRLANYKVPKHFYFAVELPLLPVGKIDKAMLRRRAVELLQVPAELRS
ncbi:class I adenylate-forming enzyme family protein [Pseudohaliea rubra]|uniref:Long-chain-fatty-acid--CoA ligase n=1 Tax=Pseudohaliea rubra DSM 19751 TaxID=1265313 RepID=A0A095VSN1_9GAMM|nr:class I adenylate-forming enzyme family protein [Pseudohaliea rubra]KGE04380.1 Long-chain-fatty-acid--CoA ligase [Pseudohaliea rubra DSM 19751]